DLSQNRFVDKTMDRDQSWVRFSCPGCRAIFRVPAHLQGSRVICPSCQKSLKLPPKQDLSDAHPKPIDEAGAVAPSFNSSISKVDSDFAKSDTSAPIPKWMLVTIFALGLAGIIALAYQLMPSMNDSMAEGAAAVDVTAPQSDDVMAEGASAVASSEDATEQNLEQSRESDSATRGDSVAEATEMLDVEDAPPEIATTDIELKPEPVIRELEFPDPEEGLVPAVPVGSVETKPRELPRPPAVASPPVAGSDQESGADKFQIHTVQRGDTLFGLGRRYGCKLDEIKRVNGIEGDVIVIGQKLKIPVPGD
ncbi:MAG: LysM peptidoglycan-binding domain-containing protein, partial [Luteolibacter sp.]